jgi:hypothetical protein
LVCGVIEPGLQSTWPALDLLALRASQEAARRCRRAALVEDLAEHLDAGDDRDGRLGLDAHDLDGVAGLDDALLDAAGRRRCRGPVIEKTSSTGIRNGLSRSRSGSGM